MWELSDDGFFYHVQFPEYSATSFSKTDLDFLWPSIIHLMKAALYDCKDLYTPEDCRAAIEQGQAQLFVFYYDAEPVGIVCSELRKTPNSAFVHILGMAGDFSVAHSFIDVFETWARMNGAASVSAVCTESRARLFRRVYGFDTSRRYIVKNLGEAK